MTYGTRWINDLIVNGRRICASRLDLDDIEDPREWHLRLPRRHYDRERKPPIRIERNP
jgi:hypothetical protein